MITKRLPFRLNNIVNKSVIVILKPDIAEEFHIVDWFGSSMFCKILSVEENHGIWISIPTVLGKPAKGSRLFISFDVIAGIVVRAK